MSGSVITVEHLSKVYRIGLREEIPDSLAAAAAAWLRAPRRNWQRLRRLDTSRSRHAETALPADSFQALNDVSFEVSEGEVLGIIGGNGAGKSTLLKILSRITEPTSGRAVIRGRVSSLLEVGTGFHPELTGRENIYMNGTLLGMRKQEIDRRFERIVDFSGVERFLDTAVKRYSSGMKVRLAFAVAAHLEPEVLIIDEVLAVGDAEFQRKCLGRMQDVATSGRTVLFVSHNMHAVRTLCTRGLALHGGQVQQLGPADDVVAWYLSQTAGQATRDISRRTDREGDGSARCTGLWFENSRGERVTDVALGEPLRICLQYELREANDSCEFHIGIYDRAGLCLARNSTKFSPLSDPLPETRGVVVCDIAGIPLAPGEYSINTCIDRAGGGRADHVNNVRRLHVVPADLYGSGRIPPAHLSPVVLDYRWMARDFPQEVPLRSAG